MTAFEERKERIHQQSREIAAHLLPLAKKRVDNENTYVCPFCGHGKGGDGLKFIARDRHGMHCFTCDWSGDVIQLYMDMQKVTYADAVNALEDIAGFRDLSISPAHSTPRLQAPATLAPNPERTAALKRGQAQIDGACDYLASRGLTVDIARRFGIGYDPETRRVLIPMGKDGYCWRYAGDADADRVQRTGMAKGSTASFFPVDVLQAPGPLFVCEGWADALSVMEADGSAVSLNSTSNTRPFVDALKSSNANSSCGPIILALDKDEPGEKVQARLADTLSTLGIPFVHSTICGAQKDPNEAWCIDKDAFRAAVAHDIAAANEAAKRVPPLQTLQGTQEIEPPLPPPEGAWYEEPDVDLAAFTIPQGYSTVEYMDDPDGFAADVSRVAGYSTRFTGYANLDSIGPFWPGLYVIGASSSLGKTTFAWQLGEQLAAAGDSVLYFSLEQGYRELLSKSLARASYLIDPQSALTGTEIRFGMSNLFLERALQRHRDTVGDRLRFYKLDFHAGVGGVMAAADAHMEKTGSPPVVIVDYLQAIARPGRGQTAKDATDEAMMTVKTWQERTNATVVFISSINRANYLVPVDFEAFKESGGIEFTSDVVWGLDLQCLLDPVFAKEGYTVNKREIVAAAKSETPRQIRLRCLKNRAGVAAYTCSFEYLPQHDLFRVVEDSPGRLVTLGSHKGCGSAILLETLRNLGTTAKTVKTEKREKMDREKTYNYKKY